VPRLFVAAWLPEAVLDRLEALPRADEPGVRWTRRDQWHVTLRFLGDAEIDEASAALARLAAPAAQVELGPRVSRLGRSVICLPARGLEGVARQVVERTAGIGEPPDPRPFTGHVTLARLRHRGACGLAGAAFSARFPVTEVHLVRSTTLPDGAVYETVAVRLLG
jgi:2'-5' RNA ligase